MDTENHSTEGDSSSHSQQSSAVSDFGISDGDEDGDHCNTLQSLLRNDVMRTDAEVADHLCLTLDAWLECAPPACSEQIEDRSGFTLLRLLELQDSSIVERPGAFTTFAPSETTQTSSSSSSNANGGSVSQSSNDQGGGPGAPPAGKDHGAANDDKKQLTKSQKNASRSNSFI